RLVHLQGGSAAWRGQRRRQCHAWIEGGSLGVQQRALAGSESLIHALQDICRDFAGFRCRRRSSLLLRILGWWCCACNRIRRHRHVRNSIRHWIPLLISIPFANTPTKTEGAGFRDCPGKRGWDKLYPMVPALQQAAEKPGTDCAFR